MDRKWLKREWRNAPQQLQSCLGCHKSVTCRYLHKHEQRCVKYRDQCDAHFLEESSLLRRQVTADEATVAALEVRVSAQADTIEDLEDHVEELESIIERQEEVRRIYHMEQGRTLRTVEVILSRLTNARQFLRTAQSRHRVIMQEADDAGRNADADADDDVVIPRDALQLQRDAPRSPSPSPPPQTRNRNRNHQPGPGRSLPATPEGAAERVEEQVAEAVAEAEAVAAAVTVEQTGHARDYWSWSP